MTVNRRFLYWGVFLVAAGGRDARRAGRRREQRRRGAGAAPLARRGRSRSAPACSCAAPGSGSRAACWPPRCPACSWAGCSWPCRGSCPGCGGVAAGNVRYAAGNLRGAASVDLTLACGDLSVITVPGTGWQLQSGNAGGATPAVDVSADRLSVDLGGRVATPSASRPAATLAAVAARREHARPRRRGERGSGPVRPRRRPARERPPGRQRGRRAGGPGRGDASATCRCASTRPRHRCGCRRARTLRRRPLGQRGRTQGLRAERARASDPRHERARLDPLRRARPATATPGRAPAIRWQTTTRT